MKTKILFAMMLIALFAISVLESCSEGEVESFKEGFREGYYGEEQKSEQTNSYGTYEEVETR